MIIRKCDYCGKEINIFIKVQTTICGAEGYEYVNVSGLLHLKRNFELCKDCAEEMLNYILGKKEKEDRTIMELRDKIEKLENEKMNIERLFNWERRDKIEKLEKEKTNDHRAS